jgi:hypothetical protein
MLLAFTGCQKSKPTTASPRANIDACSLITNDEVQKIEESAVKDAKSSESSDDSFRIAQCFYTTEVFNKSVSLAITQRNSASEKGRDPKEFWKETFGRYEGQLKEKDGDEEKKKSLSEQDEERGTPPKKIGGIGDDAWWSANRMGGALYILKDNVFIRISVGGPESEESRIDKSKALAAKALSRL